MPSADDAERDHALVLLPGSRIQELRHHLPVMIRAAKQGAAPAGSLDDVAIAAAPGRTRADYALAEASGIAVTWSYPRHGEASQFAWVASGTATLEAALLEHLMSSSTKRVH